MGYSLGFTQAIALMVRIGAMIEIKKYEYVSTRDLARDLNIPRPTVVQLIGKLTAAGLLETKEGQKGGVRLILKPETINLKHILEAIELNKPLFRMDLNININNPLVDIVRKKVSENLKQVEQAMKRQLEKISLEMLFAYGSDNN